MLHYNLSMKMNVTEHVININPSEDIMRPLTDVIDFSSSVWTKP